MTRADEFFHRAIQMLKSSPGGVLEDDFRPMMDELGYSQRSKVERTLSSILIGVPVWDELDEEGARWWHLSQPEDAINKRPMMAGKRK